MHPVLKNKRQPFGAGNRYFDSEGSSPKWLLFLGKNSNVGQRNEVDQIRLNSYSAFIDISTTCLPVLAKIIPATPRLRLARARFRVKLSVEVEDG